jgi:hypothetical protein
MRSLKFHALTVNVGIYIHQRYTAFEKSSMWDLRFAQTTVVATKTPRSFADSPKHGRSTFLETHDARLQNKMESRPTRPQVPSSDCYFKI